MEAEVEADIRVVEAVTPGRLSGGGAGVVGGGWG